MQIKKGINNQICVSTDYYTEDPACLSLGYISILNRTVRVTGFGIVFLTDGGMRFGVFAFFAKR